MKLAGRNKQLLIPWIGSLALIVSLIVICAGLCPSDPYGSEFPLNANCTFTSHAFVQDGIELSSLFIIPLLGLLLIKNRSIILDGFFGPLYKPPRFHV